MSARHVVPMLLLLGVLVAACGPADQTASEAMSTEQLVAEGENLYRSSCAQCHGDDLGGTNAGPQLLHPLYGPDRLSDDAIADAVSGGVPPRHWDFGPMPMQAVGDDDLRAIIAYVRSVQRAQGTAP